MRSPSFPLAALAALVGCAQPPIADHFIQLDVRVVPDEEVAALEFLPVIESAQDELFVALPHADDTAVADAIIERWEAGVDVRVVSDVDRRAGVGFDRLRDAGVPIRFGDGAVTYYDFAAQRDVTWESEQVIMSHAFAVADRRQIVNATAVGGLGGGAQVVTQMTGENPAEELWAEHNQIFGGVDATALTSFSAPAKSRTDVRGTYGTATEATLDLWFGPQQRVTKRVIDAIYSARRSVRVMTDELANDGLARALAEKSAWGFDVQLIVGPDFGTTLAPLRQQVENELPLVDKYRFTDDVTLPTVVLLDIEGGPDVLPQAFVLSHDLYSAGRFYVNILGQFREVTTDQLIDGNLTGLTHHGFRAAGDGSYSDPGSQLVPLIELYEDHLSRSGAFE